MSCPPGKIINPASGRCVQIKGKIGQSVVAAQEAEKLKTRQSKHEAAVEQPTEKKQVCKHGKHYNKAMDECECPTDKINNPATERCVLRSGALGQKILTQKKRQDEITIRPILKPVEPPKPPTPRRRKPMDRRDPFADEDELVDGDEDEQKDVKPCPPNKIRNVTGRCVKRDGAIGKRIGQAPTAIHLPRCKRITGPLSFTYHTSTTYGKQFLIFGDQHKQGASCNNENAALDVSEWIKRLITDNPYVLFDVFLESDTKESSDAFNANYWRYGVSLQPFGSSLEKVINLFADQCAYLRYPNGEGYAVGAVKRVPDVCSYANTRVHYSDIRTRWTQPYEFLIHNLTSLFEYDEAGDEGAVALQSFRLVQSQGLVMSQLRGTSAKDLKEKCGITDLLSRIEEKRVVDVLNREFTPYTKRLETLDPVLMYEEAEKLTQACLAGNGLQYVRKLKLESGRSNRGIFTQERILYLVEALACYMDWYLMAGVFSQFNLTHTAQNLKTQAVQDELEQKEKKTRLVARKQREIQEQVTQTPEPRFVIIYAGEEHVKKYRKVLSLLKCIERRFPLTAGMDRCIDVSSWSSTLPVTV